MLFDNCGFYVLSLNYVRFFYFYIASLQSIWAQCWCQTMVIFMVWFYYLRCNFCFHMVTVCKCVMFRDYFLIKHNRWDDVCWRFITRYMLYIDNWWNIQDARAQMSQMRDGDFVKMDMFPSPDVHFAFINVACTCTWYTFVSIIIPTNASNPIQTFMIQSKDLWIITLFLLSFLYIVMMVGLFVHHRNEWIDCYIKIGRS